MAIILKNLLNADVTYGTNPQTGSGIIKANGDTASIKGTSEVYWNLLGNNGTGASFKALDNNQYTIEVSEKKL